ncbi:MAG: DUF4124 domain-containing protein [Rhodocyclaceae bacterium]|nr:DUF4124 domain-containing protein [Rhodocyclaceae bacterium]
MPPLTCLPRATLAVCLLIAAGLAGAQVHMWKDAEGRTHYSDIPPPDIDARKLDIKVAPPQGNASSGGRSVSEMNESFEQRRSEREDAEAKAADEAAQKAKLERQCLDAGRRLEALNSGQRVARLNDAGEREFLTDDQRKEEADHLKALMAERCK